MTTTKIETVELPAIGVRDVIKPDTFYNPDQLAELLGIATRILENDFRRTGWCSQRTGGGQFLGKEIADWVEGTHVEVKIPEHVRRAYGRAKLIRQQRASPPAQPSRPPTTTDLLAELDEAETKEKGEWRQSVWRKYLDVLRRFDNPSPQDAQLLRDLIRDRDLDIKQEDIKEDVEIIRSVERLRALHDELPQAGQKLAERRRKFIELQERYKRELRDADMAVSHADGHRGSCMGAQYEVTRLRQKRPQLFEDKPGFPELLTPLVEKQVEVKRTGGARNAE